MITKQEIIDTIFQTAKNNGRKPLGVARFGKETGIKPYEWGYNSILIPISQNKIDTYL